LLLTAAYLLALATNATPYLRGPTEWRWQRYPLPGIQARLWLPLVACFILGTVVLLWVDRAGPLPRRSVGARLAFLVVAAGVMQAALLYLEHPDVVVTLFYRTVSPSSGGYFNVATGITDLGDLLRRYPAQMPTFAEIHPRTHPPGLLILFWGMTRLLARVPALSELIGMKLRLYRCADLSLMRLSNAQLASALVQMAMPFISGLTVGPLYGLGRRVWGQRVALRAAALYIIVPSLVLWATRWDQLYPLLATLGLYGIQRGLDTGRLRYFVGAGLVVSLATFLSLGNGVIGVLLVVYTLLWLLVTRRLAATEGPEKGKHPAPRWSWRQIVSAGTGLGLGLAAVWLLYYLSSGVGVWAIYQAALQEHCKLNRSYWLWVGYNLYDFLVFLGLPVALAFLSGVWGAIRRLRAGQADAGVALTIAFVLVLVGLDLSGTVRGEVARLWLFLVPVAVLVAAQTLSEGWGQAGFAVVLAAQLGQLLVSGYYLRPVGTGYPIYTPHQASYQRPAISHPQEALFGESIALLGYDLDREQVRAGESLTLTLYWQSQAQVPCTYTVFTHLVGADGRIWGQKDAMPRDGSWPTTCWRPGEVITDVYVIPVSPAAPPGIYRLKVGLYRLDLYLQGDPHHRLVVRTPAGESDHLTLGAVEVLENKHDQDKEKCDDRFSR